MPQQDLLFPWRTVEENLRIPLEIRGGYTKAEIKEKTEDNKYADNQFFGPWVSFKTTHTISINGTTKDSVPNMMEKIQLVKPWEISPVPHVLRK